MKKINLMLGMVLLATVITTTCKAQLFLAKIAGSMAAKSVIKHAFFTPDESTSVEAKDAAKAEKAAAKVNKANIRALKDFNSGFKDEQNVNWYNGTEVISASFTKDDIQTTVCYDKSGRWLRNMKVYQEDKLPKDVKRIIKRSDYADYRIPVVQEIKEGDNTFYIVHLEDATTYNQVCVCNGEMNLYKSYTKQL